MDFSATSKARKQKQYSQLGLQNGHGNNSKQHHCEVLKGAASLKASSSISLQLHLLCAPQQCTNKPLLKAGTERTLHICRSIRGAHLVGRARAGIALLGATRVPLLGSDHPGQAAVLPHRGHAALLLGNPARAKPSHGTHPTAWAIPVAPGLSQQCPGSSTSAVPVPRAGTAEGP